MFIFFVYLNGVYGQFPRGQDGVLPCALTERNTILLPEQAWLRDPLCYTHKLGLGVFHHCYLLLLTPNRWRDCKGVRFYIKSFSILVLKYTNTEGVFTLITLTLICILTSVTTLCLTCVFYCTLLVETHSAQ